MSHTCLMTACLVLALAPAPSASAQKDPGKRVSIDVTHIAPQKAFEMLAREAGCTITVDPAVQKPLTLRVVEMPVAEVVSMICRKIGCEYRFDGKDFFIKPLSAGRKQQTAVMEKHSEKFDSRLPEGMRFERTPLEDVLKAVGKASGLELRPWQDEGSRKVTIDVGGKTVDEALDAILRQIAGEGVVVMKTWAGSWGQAQ